MQRLLRNGKSHDTSVESKKRSYKKSLKAATTLATVQATVLDTVIDTEVDLAEYENVQEMVLVDVPIAESENEQEMSSLRLDESNQNISFSSILPSTSSKRKLPDDSLQNIQSLSSSSSSEDLYAASPPPTPQPPQKKPKRKRCVYELVEEFNSYENVDAYLRLHNQYSIYTTNNNPVNCTFRQCRNVEKHTMKQMYMHCSCKKNECDLKYSLCSCEHVLNWKLSKSGEHVLVLAETGLAENISKLNIPAIVIKLMLKIVDDNPDYKAKSVKTHMTKQKNKFDLLKKVIRPA